MIEKNSYSLKIVLKRDFRIIIISSNFKVRYNLFIQKYGNFAIVKLNNRNL